ncbi:hypothetical protein [Leucothrix pacifica]|uniref:HEAT repeat domain-containing protein n=1 Tax=Leucothrix pacifica TaxID=1247513 RepID=A0A317CME2_9GAMM|nr:hypothetical protein [Leucothrix pacifica]PWQ99785.1 hypothetical protein DKW60_04740 [Leucothrix pacifica]
MMRDLSVSTLVVFFAELVLFALLWTGQPSLILIVSALHLVVATLAAQWFSMHWSDPATSPKQVWLYVIMTVALLPVVGSLLLVLIENRSILREQGLRAGLGAEDQEKQTAKDLLNYFTAPDFHQKGSIRKTRDLLSSLDDEAYLGLLIASRHLPDKEAYALLSEALLSPFESARLMAYSLKGKLEEQMQSDLQKKLEALNSAPKKRLSELHLAVAHDYLHLLDVGVESSSKEVLLQQASDHCISAIRENNESGSAYQTLSEILEYQGKKAAARKAKLRAMNLGVTKNETALFDTLTA